MERHLVAFPVSAVSGLLVKTRTRNLALRREGSSASTRMSLRRA
ncbi:hypothetical protein ACFXEL_32375 [Streptomyces sp. NPDC059382]